MPCKAVLWLLLLGYAYASKQVSKWVPLLDISIPLSSDDVISYLQDAPQLQTLLEQHDYEVKELSPWTENLSTAQSGFATKHCAGKMAQRHATFSTFTKAFFGSYTSEIIKTQQLTSNADGCVVFQDTVDAVFHGTPFLKDMHTVCMWTFKPEPNEKTCRVFLEAQVRLPVILNVVGQVEKKVLTTTQVYGKNLIANMLAWSKAKGRHDSNTDARSKVPDSVAALHPAFHKLRSLVFNRS